MSDAIETTDLTERAASGGWVLPDGWAVKADLTYDDAITGPSEEFDCYSDGQIAAWRNADWMFVVVSVWVQDANGRVWGRSVLGGVEYGDVPGYEDGAPTYYLNPLDVLGSEYDPIREHDMIGEALREAVKALDSFGTPAIVEPAGTTVTGL